MKYTKEFERYWNNTVFPELQLFYVKERLIVKKIAFNAFQAGKTPF